MILFVIILGLIPSLALQQHRMALQRQKRDQVRSKIKKNVCVVVGVESFFCCRRRCCCQDPNKFNYFFKCLIDYSYSGCCCYEEFFTF